MDENENTMNEVVSLNNAVFIVEERLVENPGEINYAWTHTDASSALEQLVEEIKAHGPTRLYSCYLSIN